MTFICPPPSPDTLDMKAVLAVGFGMVTVTKDGEAVWSGDDEDQTIAPFEERAQQEGGEWAVEFYGPLSESTYTRSGTNDWRLTGKGRGFA